MATRFLSPTGNDGAAGTRAAPWATFAPVVSAHASGDEVVMLAGDYAAPILDISSIKSMSIRADWNAAVKCYYGESVAGSGFTLHSNAFAVPIYKKVISTAIPDISPWTNWWLFEQDTGEIAITSAKAHPLQQGRSYALEHFRMKRQASINAVGAAAGRHYFDSGTGTLYISATTGGSPSGKTYRIPSMTTTDSFTKGYGTGETNLTICGIQTFFGYRGFFAGTVNSLRLVRCTGFGAAECGVAADGCNEVWLERNRWAGNNNDGSSVTANNITPRALLRATDEWSAYNADGGHDTHYNYDAVYRGGLLEGNLSSGSTAFGGAMATWENVFTRDNGEAGLELSGGGTPVGNAYAGGCVSEGDGYAILNSNDGGRFTLRDLLIVDPLTGPFNAGSGAIIHGRGIHIIGATKAGAGAGTCTINP